MKIIDPYGTQLYKDYTKVIKQFGLEVVDVKQFPNPNVPLRRGLAFAGRDLKIITDAIKNKKSFYVLTGIMPSSQKIHLGTKTVIEQVKYFQEQGAHTFVLIADLEAMMTRVISLEEAQTRAKTFHIPAYLALGLNPKKTTFYFQSSNKEVMHLAYSFASKVTSNEYKAIYGSTDPSRIMSALTQAADIIYPQLQERMPGIVPVGIDQDPHMRLTRDIIRRSKDKKFFLPSSLYHQFTPSLDGSMKMSKSSPQGNIELPEDKVNYTKKIMRALTGGRATLEEHRKLGAEVEKCMVFSLLKMHLIEDDDELEHIYNAYKSGNLSSGQLKKLAVEKMDIFMQTFAKKLNLAKSASITLVSS